MPIGPLGERRQRGPGISKTRTKLRRTGGQCAMGDRQPRQDDAYPKEPAPEDKQCKPLAPQSTTKGPRHNDRRCGGTNQLVDVSLSGRAGTLAVGEDTRPSEELVILCRPMATCQRGVKAIPLSYRTDHAEIFGMDRADCDGTHFAEPPFWRMVQPVALRVAYPSAEPSIRE